MQCTQCKPLLRISGALATQILQRRCLLTSTNQAKQKWFPSMFISLGWVGLWIQHPHPPYMVHFPLKSKAATFFVSSERLEFFTVTCF